MKAYKVVARSNSKSFEPATSAALQRIRYRIGRVTRKVEHEHGPFALFETEEQARDFASTLNHKLSILLCEYEPSGEDELWKKLPPSFGRSHGSMTFHSNGTTERLLENCPTGTILADAVLPLELIIDGI